MAGAARLTRVLLFVVLSQEAVQQRAGYPDLIKSCIILIQRGEEVLRDRAVVLEMVANGIVLPDRKAPSLVETAGHAGLFRQALGLTQQSPVAANIRIVLAHGTSPYCL